MFIPFRIKIVKEDNEKLDLERLGIKTSFEEDELDEMIVEVNPMHIVSIEPFERGYLTSLSNGTDLITEEHPFRSTIGNNYN